MKTLIILALVVLLLLGAFLSRPGEQSFRDYIESRVQIQLSTDALQGVTAGRLGGLVAGTLADHYVKDATYRNRLLYATVDVDGQTEYVGAFGRWFRWADGELTISTGR